MRLLMPLFVIGATLAVAGCQTIGGITGIGSSHPQAEPDQTPTTTAMSAPATTPAKTAAKNSLAGMGADRLVSLWGEPSLKRKEIGSELWQYGNGKSECAVLVYVYPLAGGALTVSHAEAVPGGADDATISSCAMSNGLPPLKPTS